jgi:hypothetical protein
MKILLCGNPHPPLCGFVPKEGMTIAAEPVSVPVKKKVKYLLIIDLTENEEKILVALNRKYATKQPHVHEPGKSITFGFEFKGYAESRLESFAYVLQDLFKLRIKSKIRTIGFLEETHFHNNSKVA